MPGDVDNASLWADADVFIAAIGATIPATVDDPFGVAWGQVGLLDGDAGFVTSRNQDKADHYAWGGVLVRTSRRNFKETKKFTLLEDNEVTRDLIWPGSSPGVLVVPRPVPILLGMETREGDVVHRLITKKYAEVEVEGDYTENEGDLTKYPMLATIFPDATLSPAELWIEQATAGFGS